MLWSCVYVNSIEHSMIKVLLQNLVQSKLLKRLYTFCVIRLSIIIKHYPIFIIVPYVQNLHRDTVLPFTARSTK